MGARGCVRAWVGGCFYVGVYVHTCGFGYVRLCVCMYQCEYEGLGHQHPGSMYFLPAFFTHTKGALQLLFG